MRKQELQYFATPERDFKDIRSIFIAIMLFFASTLSISLASFFRRDFGSRFFTPISFIIGLLFMNFLTWTTQGMAVDRGGIGGVQLLPFFTFVFLVMGFYHFWKLWVNRKLNNHILSYYDGRSHLEPIAEWISERPSNLVFRFVIDFLARFTLTSRDRQQLNSTMLAVPSIRDTDRFTKMWLEPGFGVLLALIFSADYFVSAWFGLASICLFFSSYLIIRGRRRRELDAADNMLHAQYQRQMLEVDKSIADQVRQHNEGGVIKPLSLSQLQLSPAELNPDLSSALAEIEVDLLA